MERICFTIYIQHTEMKQINIASLLYTFNKFETI